MPSGRYNFGGVPPGSVSVEFSYPGLNTRRACINIGANCRNENNANLNLETASETVEVAAESLAGAPQMLNAALGRQSSEAEGKEGWGLGISLKFL